MTARYEGTPGAVSQLDRAEALLRLRLPGAQHVVRLFRWEKRLIARFAATALGRSAASLAVILLIKEFLAGAVGTQEGLAASLGASLGSMGALWLTAGALFACYVTSALCAYDNQVTQQRIVKILELGMMERLIRHLLTLSVPFFDRQEPGDIIQAVRQDISELRQVVTGLANIVFEGLLAVALFVSALVLSPWLTLWGLIVLPCAVVPIYVIARRTLQRSYTVRKTGYVLFDVILQLISGIRIIKAYRGEDLEARTGVECGRRYFDELIEMVRVRAMSTVVLESLAGLGIVVVIVVGGLAVMGEQLAWPSLLAFVMAMRALQGPLNNMNTHYVQVQMKGAAVQRLDELFRVVPEIRSRPGARRVGKPPSRIAFDSVTFAYGEQTVLDDVSFEVRAGETIGIVGPSGAGKTTLLNLLVRFYDPSAGAVRFDASDLRDLRLGDIYDQVAIVTQSPFLFAATVRDNIAYGRAQATQAEIEAAAEAAYVHDEILALPKGYDTVIGVGGRTLSGGQQQRINVARALLKDAPILLLDEATSALDSIAEAQVQQAIERLMEGRTSFVIAHRLSTLRNADQILVLDRGRLVGFAPHAELVRSCPIYAQIWEAQRLEGGEAGDSS